MNSSSQEGSCNVCRWSSYIGDLTGDNAISLSSIQFWFRSRIQTSPTSLYPELNLWGVSFGSTDFKWGKDTIYLQAFILPSGFEPGIHLWGSQHTNFRIYQGGVGIAKLLNIIFLKNTFNIQKRRDIWYHNYRSSWVRERLTKFSS